MARNINRIREAKKSGKSRAAIGQRGGIGKVACRRLYFIIAALCAFM